MQVARLLWYQLTPRRLRFGAQARWGILSNGPGDPAATASYAGAEIAKLIDANMPIFGICIGHQLMALALAKIYKMARGHRGANHPVRDLQTGKMKTAKIMVLPSILKICQLNLRYAYFTFDQSIEGLRTRRSQHFVSNITRNHLPDHMTLGISLNASPT